MKYAHLLILGAMAGAALTTAMYSAESNGAGVSGQTVMEELRAQEDPTILKGRIWLDTEWNRFKDDSDDLLETVGRLWTWRVSEDQDWAVRLKVPINFHFAGNADGDSDRAGLGDVKLATGTAFRLSDSWRTAVAVELRFPSASSDLGNDAWQLQLLGAAAWDATRQLTTSPSFEYNKSVAENAGAARQHFLELFFPVTYLLPGRWSVTPRYEAKVDFENDQHWTHAGKLAVAKQLEALPLGFSLSVKKPFDPGNKRFQVNFVVNYYFR